MVTEHKYITAAKAEIARQAAMAYTSDGQSMYDSIRVTSRDEDTLVAYLDDASSALAARFKGRAKWDAEVGEIKFDLPGSAMIQNGAMDKSLQDAVSAYVVSYICAEWFKRRHVAKYEEYAGKAQASLERVVILAKTRKEPSKGGISL